MSSPSAAFETAFAITVGVEGGYTNNPSDPGNWTGGKIGAGVCKGTNCGISAAAYPNLDIASLTLDQVKGLYLNDYWSKSGCDLCPDGLAICVFDAAVNNGVGQAIRWLQSAVGATPDGAIGPATRAAIAAIKDLPSVVSLFHGARIAFMAGLSTWPTFKGGWSKRLALVPYRAGMASPAAIS